MTFCHLLMPNLTATVFFMTFVAAKLQNCLQNHQVH